MTHLLDDARGQMREGHTSAQWELIAREKVMRTLLETGEFTADDLADLNIPVEYRRHVHGAATGHFSGAQPFMEFVTRRKSERPSRKGAKNDVFRINAKGRRELPRLLRDLQSELTLVGSSSGVPGGSAAALSGEEQEIVGVGIDHRGDGEGEGSAGHGVHVPPSSVGANSGDHHSDDSEGNQSVSPADSLDRPDGSPELPSDGAGSPIAAIGAGHPPRSKSAASSPPALEAATRTGSPETEPLQLDDARRRAPSAFDPWSDAA